MEQKDIPEIVKEIDAEQTEAIELTFPTFLEYRLYLISSVILVGSLTVPFVSHFFGIAGQIFMPLYLFALLAGLVYGWRCGLLVGLLAPLISFSITQMPVMQILPFVMVKSALLGLISGFVMEQSKGKKLYLCAGIGVIFSLLIGNLLLYISVNNIVMAQMDFLTGYPGIILLLTAVPWISNKITKYERKIIRRYSKQVAGI